MFLLQMWMPVAGFSLYNFHNYISAEEACDWTGKREVELRVAETESIPEKRERKMAAVNQHGYDWPQETLG